MRFDRVYRLLVGPSGKKGMEIANPFRMTFDISKDTKEEPNTTTIRVYNLREDTRREIQRPDNVAVLYAGYGEEDGPLLLAAGAVSFAYTFQDGPDIVTELEVRDGYVEARDTVVSLGYGVGVKAHDIIREIARQMGLPLVMEDSVLNRQWANGFSFYGAARTALHKVVQGTGLEWSVQNQQLQIVDKLGTTKRQAIVLASDSGLIGYPERTNAGAREKAEVKDKKTNRKKRLVSAEQQTDGWRVRSLLLPQTNPADLIKVESKFLAGFYRIQSLQHTGDTDAGDWITDLQLIERQ
jgi:hypothetical protein